MDSYQQYIHKSRYARYLPEEKRREKNKRVVPAARKRHQGVRGAAAP